MKLNIVKLVVSIILAFLAGLVCYYMSTELDNRKWISFGVTTATMMLSLIMALAIDYKCGKRNSNIYLVAWIFAIAVLACNMIFVSFVYPVIIYIAVTVLLALVDFLCVYGLYKPEESSLVN